MPGQNKIVIVGAGFGGLVAALNLEKKIRRGKNTSIILIDKEDYQLFTPNLYEVATSDEEFTGVAQLKKSVTIPIKEILAGTTIKFVKAEVSEISLTAKTLLAGRTKINFDYLVLAMGSQSDYFNIEGAKEYALPLKTLTDALKIRNQIEFTLQAHRLDVSKKNLRVVIAGGGYTGCEFAAELGKMMDILAWKNQYPLEKIEILVLEGASQLIPGLSGKMSRDALIRLKELGIRVLLSSFITKVNKHFVELVTGEKIEYEVLVWTTGVKASPLFFTVPIDTDKKGRVLVTPNLNLGQHHNIFILGDQACIVDNTGAAAHCTAQDAIDQAEYLASALPQIMKNKRPKAYKVLKHGFIVAMGGKWQILNYPPFYWKGYLAYFVRQFANLRYYSRVVGWWKALKYILLQMDVYGRND